MGSVFGSTPKVSAKTPAVRPERSETVEAEDIVVGDNPDSASRKKGRRALTMPASSDSVGTGLSV